MQVVETAARPQPSEKLLQTVDFSAKVHGSLHRVDKKVKVVQANW